MKNIYLSITERDRRYRLVRAAMKERGLDVLLIWGDSGKWDWKIANVHYLSGIGGNGDEALMVFPLEGEPTIILWSYPMRSFIDAWQEYSSWVKDFRGKEGGTYIKPLIKRLKQSNLLSAKIGIPGLFIQDGTTFPAGLFIALRTELPKAKLTDASGLIEYIRAVKSPEEIALMEKATQIGEAAIATLSEIARPGIPENEVVGAMFDTMISQGNDIPIMFLWNSGRPKYVARLTFTSKHRLKKGDIICTEFSPRFRGYCSHINQTAVLGNWKEDYEKLYIAAMASYRAGFNYLKPGITAGDLARACYEPLAASGYKWATPGAPGGFNYGSLFFHGTGLSNEGPFGRWPIKKTDWIGGKDASVVIREGMTIAFEPGACSLDNERGVNMGDVVLVTRDGRRRLGKKEPGIIRCIS